MKIQQNQNKLEKAISIEDMQKIVDANEKLVKELKGLAKNLPKTEDAVASELNAMLCPCCGGEPKLEECEVGPVKMFENNAWRIQCQKCGLMLHAYEKNTVINGWNKRA